MCAVFPAKGGVVFFSWLPTARGTDDYGHFLVEVIAIYCTDTEQNVIMSMGDAHMLVVYEFCFVFVFL